jgi:IS5 family transposase
MLRTPIETGIAMGAIRPSQLKRINVDTTVQTKAIRFPTDARQIKRARAATRKLRTQLGRVMREIGRQVTEPSEKLARLLETAHQIHAQQRHDKNEVYSVHEPETECISKGKADKKYELGPKVSVAVTSRADGWMVGAKSFTGNPYDGHTLNAQLKQVDKLIGNRVSEAHVDMGYRGHDYDGAVTVRVDKRQGGQTPRALWRWMKRRAAMRSTRFCLLPR